MHCWPISSASSYAVTTWGVGCAGWRLVYCIAQGSSRLRSVSVSVLAFAVAA
jgi:hypothetical protein